MRRKDREITDTAEILAIIRENKVLRLAMTDGQTPYIVPLNYGFTAEDGKLTFYIHSAKQGRKLDILAMNPAVCVEIDSRHELVTAELDCDYGYKFASVIAQGEFIVLEEDVEKRRALTELMKHQTGVDRDYDFGDVRRLVVAKIIVDHVTAKACR